MWYCVLGVTAFSRTRSYNAPRPHSLLARKQRVHGEPFKKNRIHATSTRSEKFPGVFDTRGSARVTFLQREGIREERTFCLATPPLSALFDRADECQPRAASPWVRCRELASSSSATSRRPINTSLRREGRRGGQEDREPSTTLRQVLPPFHFNQIVAISPPISPPHSLHFSLFSFFFNLPFLPPSSRVSCPATATRIRQLGSVRQCVRYPILPSPGPDP